MSTWRQRDAHAIEWNTACAHMSGFRRYAALFGPSFEAVYDVVRTVDDPRDWLWEIVVRLRTSADEVHRALTASLLPVLERQAGWGLGVGEWPIPAIARVMAANPLSPHYGYWHELACALQCFTAQRRDLWTVLALQNRIVEEDDVEFAF